MLNVLFNELGFLHFDICPLLYLLPSSQISKEHALMDFLWPNETGKLENQFSVISIRTATMKSRSNQKLANLSKCQCQMSRISRSFVAGNHVMIQCRPLMYKWRYFDKPGIIFNLFYYVNHTGVYITNPHFALRSYRPYLCHTEPWKGRKNIWWEELSYYLVKALHDCRKANMFLDMLHDS